ncbi:hypothetical protein ACO22_02720 [Paracoccidioides brasiliensis]|uniref:Thioesterase domain-containing protein n=1 Tax=Paracoccidioides brasiliensis TaxID=121759 RepID=A0A1D2JI97_PARBR|nr:hypothetical protein ACO22_02720 [Paracoccidioides brasiliensis]
MAPNGPVSVLSCHRSIIIIALPVGVSVELQKAQVGYSKVFVLGQKVEDEVEYSDYIRFRTEVFIPSLQQLKTLVIMYGLPILACRLLDNLRVTAARPGVVNFELDIQKEHTNRLGILHGGAIASMVDLGGSLAVASRGLFATGVSTDLNVTYLNSGGKIGDKILAEVTCDKCMHNFTYSSIKLLVNPSHLIALPQKISVGKTLAFTSAKFTNLENEVVARGSHTKFVAIAFKDPKNIVHQLQPEEESEGGNKC